MPTAAEWSRISAIGATIITGTTVIAAVYLLAILYKQGRGKLRVRLLLGMVVSDLLLGVVVFPSEAASLAGSPIRTGTTICGFFLTAVLWQQHLWTLSIAAATFLLLVRCFVAQLMQKYPLSNKTTFLERYSWICAPTIWIVSLVHSGIWWRYAGWVSNGNLCYYQNTSTTDGIGASDLIQFIPRAIVFLTILGIYCSLFKFLRRPDTIQLSSQFVSGSVISRGASDPRPLTNISQRFGLKTATAPKPVDPNAPWEALEFVQVGGKERTRPTTSMVTSVQSPSESRHSATFTSPIMSVDLDHVPAPLPIPELNEKRADELDEKGAVDLDEKRDSFSLRSLDASRRSSKRPSDEGLPTLAKFAEANAMSTRHEGDQIFRSLSPIASSGKIDDPPRSPRLMQSPMEHQNQTLIEFFQEYEPENQEPPASGPDRARGGPPQMSATAYFNRQASLLMLYFPLAYLVVFSLSIARLLYNMISSTPNQLLTVVSTWFVLSVGFVDALVYGLAEFLVRRRVRKKMPDRMG